MVIANPSQFRQKLKEILDMMPLSTEERKVADNLLINSSDAELNELATEFQTLLHHVKKVVGLWRKMKKIFGM